MSKQRIFIAGHRGMVGSAIRRQLEQRGDVELVLRTRDELNLLDSRAVHDFFASESIDQVYLAAAKVGGIVANNTYPADFIYQNMMIESNIIQAAHQNGPIGIFTEVKRITRKIITRTTAAASAPTTMPCVSWLIV